MAIKGFSLIELLVTVAILAIVVAVAVPVYSGYSLRAQRTNAQADLVRCAQGLERHAAETMRYTPAVDTDGDGLADASTGPVSANLCAISAQDYDTTVHAATPGSFVLRATPKENAAAAGDGLLELHSGGVRRWDRNADGDFDDPNENSWQP